jgi:hypothetical protein
VADIWATWGWPATPILAKGVARPPPDWPQDRPVWGWLNHPQGPKPNFFFFFTLALGGARTTPVGRSGGGQTTPVAHGGGWPPPRVMGVVRSSPKMALRVAGPPRIFFFFDTYMYKRNHLNNNN